MTLSSGIWSAKSWADMEDECFDSEWCLSASTTPSSCTAHDAWYTTSDTSPTPSTCGATTSDRTPTTPGSCTSHDAWYTTSDMSPTPSICGTHDVWSLDSDVEPVQVAGLEQTVTDGNRLVILATSPEAGSARPHKLRNRPIEKADLVRSNDIATKMTPWSSQTRFRVCSASLDELADDGQDSWAPSSKRPNKPSKFRRDRYKNLVQQLQNKLDTDPTIEITNMLPSLPSFITSDEKLQGKLMARLHQHKWEQQQMLGRMRVDEDNKVHASTSRAKLESMSKSELRKFAAELDVPEAAIIGTIDAEDTKAALLELTMLHQAYQSVEAATLV